jgi:hypothetical protein
MMKFLLVLTIGVVIGYGVGYRDAKVHGNSIVTRTVERIGGSNRENFNNDLDGRSEAVSAESRTRRR